MTNKTNTTLSEQFSVQSKRINRGMNDNFPGKKEKKYTRRTKKIINK